MSPDESATEGVGRRPKLVSNGLGQIQLKKKERKKKKKKNNETSEKKSNLLNAISY